MNAEKAIVYTLQNNAAFQAVVGTAASNARVYYDEAPQAAALPRALVTLESIQPTDTKQNSNFDHDLVQVFHQASTKAVSLDMATKARTALEAAAGSINGVTVSEMRLVDQDSFTENITNNMIYTTEQLWKVTVNL